MAEFTLVGVDGNAFSVMGYTIGALKTVGLKEEARRVVSEATAGDYTNVICVCQKYIEMANEKLRSDRSL